ncbi:hypothetical protein QBC43DRAFT_58988 [Cladorrhinum sp. PSN259]|nr:hypothetical protein QBC43DRAFT_58988 [Cladorrhinum sp. PSN259]
MRQFTYSLFCLLLLLALYRRTVAPERERVRLAALLHRLLPRSSSEKQTRLRKVSRSSSHTPSHLISPYSIPCRLAGASTTCHDQQALFVSVSAVRHLHLPGQNSAIIEDGAALTDETHLADPPTKQLGALLPTLLPFDTALATTHEFWTDLDRHT